MWLTREFPIFERVTFVDAPTAPALPVRIAGVARRFPDPDGGVREVLRDVHLDIRVEREADPLGLAPTSSATVTLAIGDALAAALMTLSGFTPADFAQRHPGGSLGAQLGAAR